MREIETGLRYLVVARADHRCEYCLMNEDDPFSPHQVDHIISRKHAGRDEESNLAFACLRCNAWKGSDIASLDPLTGELMRLFNPRRQLWEDYFQMGGPIIEFLTAEGRATARLLRLKCGGANRGAPAVDLVRPLPIRAAKVTPVRTARAAICSPPIQSEQITLSEMTKELRLSRGAQYSSTPYRRPTHSPMTDI